MDVDGRVFRNPYRPMHFGVDNQYPECETHCRDRIRMIMHFKPCYCFYHVRFPLNDIVQVSTYTYSLIFYHNLSFNIENNKFFSFLKLL